MKIAVIHWYTSSVGGINTTLETLHSEAVKRGDTFHVFACDPKPTKKPILYDSRTYVKGGDTSIKIDGELPYHDKNYKSSIQFLKDNKYDVVMTSFLCPHPTKEYGEKPIFQNLFDEINLAGIPLIGYIHDAYWETYKEFGEIAIQYMEKTVLNQKAYSSYFDEYEYNFLKAFVPFVSLGESPNIERNPKKVVWLPQWKPIKGINKFWKGMPQAISSGLEIDLYGNGIEYYYIRKEDSWKKVVGKDYFDDAFSGEGKAIFYGYVETSKIPSILSDASFMCDFQGHSSKYSAYLNGSYNHTILEALYFGAVPVVHSNMLKSGIPSELLLTVNNVENWPSYVNKYDLGSFNKKLAREYVQQNHNSSKLFDMIFEEFRKGYKADRKQIGEVKRKPKKQVTEDDFFG